MDFAVAVKGIHEEGKGSWVLAVAGDKVLISHGDNTLHWHPMKDCKAVNFNGPDQPTLVMIVQPKSGDGLVIATPQGPNRAARRRGEGY